MRYVHWPDEVSRMDDQVFVPAYPDGVYGAVPAIGAIALANLVVFV